MKFKIEIWQNHKITEVKESNNLKELVDWFKLEWEFSYEFCLCTFYVYEDDEPLSFNEEVQVIFYDGWKDYE